MKWLIGCLLALVMVTAGFAGEDPYIAIVGNDAIQGLGDGVANPFYFSPKHQQFLYDQTLFDVPVCFGTFPGVMPQTRVGGIGCEQFRSNTPINQPEICDTTGTVLGVGDFIFFGEPNARITAGNQGYYEWWIRLPKKPSGEINICIQCGILKPNAFAFEEFNAVNLCAAETGERLAPGLCVRQEVEPGVNPLLVAALPKITAIAYPGPYAFETWPAFHLTAFKNPGNYFLDGGPASIQVLDGSINTRVLLKSCLDKCVVAKLPVTDQTNTITGEREHDLEAGDLIYVRMDVPRQNVVDIYCHSQSARIAGVGEAPF